MTKKKIERIDVMYRKEITWLKWYFLRDKKNPRKTILEQMIHESFLRKDVKLAAFLTNIRTVTDKFIQKSDRKLLETIKQVYVYENINVIGACQRILYRGQTSAYNLLNDWFEGYYLAMFDHLPLKL